MQNLNSILRRDRTWDPFFSYLFRTKNFCAATPTVSNVTLVDSHISEWSDEFKGGKILLLEILLHTANDIRKSLFLRQMRLQKATFEGYIGTKNTYD